MGTDQPVGKVVNSVGVEDTVTPALIEPQALAVSPSGEELYVGTASGALKYTLGLGAYTQSGTLGSDSAAVGGLTISSSGDVFIDQENNTGHSEVIEYEPSGNEVMRSAAGAIAAPPLGIATYDGSVYIAESERNLIQVFGEGQTPEAPLTEPAGEVTDTAAVLHGTLNPHASAKVDWYFAYNTNGTCRNGTIVPVPLPAEAEGQAVDESADISGVEASTDTYCIVASGAYGPEYGAPVAFETAPEPVLTEVLSEPASEVKAASAALNGRLNPEGDASYYFEYCANTAPGTCPGSEGKSPQTEVTSIESHSPQSVGPLVVDGLLPETTYHYWLVASNGREASCTARKRHSQPLSTRRADSPRKPVKLPSRPHS